MRKLRTEEEKIAKKLADLVSNVSIDLDQIGIYLANLPNIYYNRLLTVIESAEHEKEMTNVRQHDTLF